MSVAIVGIELDGLIEFELGSGEIPIEMQSTCQGSVSFGQRGINFERAKCRLLRLGTGLFGRKVTEITERVIGVGDADVSERVPGVLCNRLLEVLEPSLQIFFRALIPEVPALEVELIRLWVDGKASGQAQLLYVGKFGPYLVGDVACHLVLVHH